MILSHLTGIGAQFTVHEPDYNDLHATFNVRQEATAFLPMTRSMRQKLLLFISCLWKCFIVNNEEMGSLHRRR